MFKTIKNQISAMIMFCTFSICISANTINTPVIISDEFAPQGVETACEPDCPETPFPLKYDWKYAYDITLPGGCVVTVQYTTRFACNM
jgi:hypothetical protein